MAQHATWAEKTKETPDGKWVTSKFQSERVRDGQGILGGAIAGLNLEVNGAIHLLSSNELRFDYDFKAAKEV